MKRTLRAALPRAQTVDAGSMVSVFFSASLADGTLLRSNRDDQPLEIRVGAQPSDAVRFGTRACVQVAVLSRCVLVLSLNTVMIISSLST